MYIILEEFFPRIPGLDQIAPIETFMKYAFMPLLVAFPLSIGMIMIFAGNALTSVSGVSSDSISSFLAGDFYSLLWWAAAIGVLWVGSRKAIEASGGIAANLTQSVYDGVNGFGKAAASSLKYAPIFPIPAGDGLLDFNGLTQQPKLFRRGLEEKSNKNARAFAGMNKDSSGADFESARENVAHLASQKDSHAHNKLLEKGGGGGSLAHSHANGIGQMRHDYLTAIGASNIPSAKELASPATFEETLHRQTNLNENITGHANGSDLHEKLAGASAAAEKAAGGAAKLSAAAEEILAKIRAAQTAEELAAAYESAADANLTEEDRDLLKDTFQKRKKDF